jgi:hypothetical protein
MEPNLLNIDRDNLFTSIKRDIAAETKFNKMFFILLGLFLVGFLCYYAIFSHAGTSDILHLVGLFVAIAAFSSYSILWCNKYSRARNAQELLALYDKWERNEKWSFLLIIVFVLILWFILEHVVGYFSILGLLALLIIVCYNFKPILSKKSDIEQLRELVQNPR